MFKRQKHLPDGHDYGIEGENVLFDPLLLTEMVGEEVPPEVCTGGRGRNILYSL